MNSKSIFLGPKYVLEYSQDYFDLLWYERDLMRYLNYLNYKDLSDDRDNYFKNKKVINFK